MLIRRMLIVLLSLAVSATDAGAQRRGGTGTWVMAGAGAGFGIGLWAGLTAFDDAVDSDRKVWTSAIAGAALGGTAGYLVGRARKARRHPAASPAPPVTPPRRTFAPEVVNRVTRSYAFPLRSAPRGQSGPH